MRTLVLDPSLGNGGSEVSCYRLSVGAVPVGDVVESVDHVHLQPVPRDVMVAREFIRANAPMLREDLLDTVLLLTSELVTNAVIHARTPLEVGMTVTDRSVIITVHDEDLTMSPERGAREGGWGLGLVRELAADWAMEQHVTAGKTAWFRIRRAESAA